MSIQYKAEAVINVRFYGGAYIARCNGKTASCTISARTAAERVAMKVAGVLTDPNSFPRFMDSGIEIEDVTPSTFIMRWLAKEGA